MLLIFINCNFPRRVNANFGKLMHAVDHNMPLITTCRWSQHAVDHNMYGKAFSRQSTVKLCVKAALDLGPHSNRSGSLPKPKLHISCTHMEAAAWKRRPNIVFVDLSSTALCMPKCLFTFLKQFCNILKVMFCFLFRLHTYQTAFAGFTYSAHCLRKLTEMFCLLFVYSDRSISTNWCMQCKQCPSFPS